MRTGTTDQIAKLASDAAQFCLFVELDITPTQYLCTSDHNIDWNGHTWSGTGALAFIEEIKENAGLETSAIRMGMAGSPTGISLALTADYQGKECKVYFGVLDSNYRVIDTPLLEHKGFIDIPTVVDNRPSSLSISVTVETRLARMLQKRSWRFSHADQLKLHPGDMYFEFLPQMAEKVFAWGARYGK